MQVAGEGRNCKPAAIKNGAPKMALRRTVEGISSHLKVQQQGGNAAVQEFRAGRLAFAGNWSN
jgi:hypothetical protein